MLEPFQCGSADDLYFPEQISLRARALGASRGFSLLLALIFILLTAADALAQGLFVNPMVSPRQPNELDTADTGGQAARASRTCRRASARISLRA